MSYKDRLAFWNRENVEEWSRTLRSSRRMILFIVFISLLLDNLLLTTVVPIIPDYLFGIDQRARREVIGLLNQTLTMNNRTEYLRSCTLPVCSIAANNVVKNRTISLAQEVLQKAVVPDLDLLSENSKVGWLLSSRSIVQLVANPVIGPLSNRVGYSVLLLSGCLVIAISSFLFAFGESFVPLVLARGVQGFGSACTAISGMSMIADIYPDDVDRSRAMGIAMGGTAMGTLLGYPFGSFLYTFVGKVAPFLIIVVFVLLDAALQALILRPTFREHSAIKGTSLHVLLRDPYILVAAGAIMFTTMSMAILEPTVPIWVMDTMDVQKWQLGLVFLPDSIGYLLGTNLFGVIAQKIGRWICAIACLLMIGLCLICIPFATNLTHLILPHFGLGLGLGITDAAIMPHLALLLDTRYAAVYGSVYAIAQVAVCLGYAVGPSVGGQVVKSVGFPWLMRGMAIFDMVYCPLCYFLRPSNNKEENVAILSESNPNVLYACESKTRDSTFSYGRLYEDE